MSGECEYSENRGERLVSLLYEDGDPAELAEMRAHLATCAACREELEKLTETRELLGAWPDVVNVPRMVYVNEPAPSARRGGGAGRAGASSRWSRFRPFLPSVAAAAAVILMLGACAPFVRFQVGQDGRLHVGFGASPASATEQSALVTKGDLDQGLTQTAQYLEALVRNGRQQDRQAVLDAVDQALRAQSTSTQAQVTTAINSAFDQMDRQRRADLSVLLSSMNDLQVMTQSQLQQMSAVLASLTPAPGPDQE